MNYQQFFTHFETQNFDQALDAFQKLDHAEQKNLLKQLYYEAREAKQPVGLSVLYRKLHPGKKFEDFHEAWMPPKSAMKPFNVGEKTYHYFFETPVRIIHGVNLTDPSEVISVGIIWCSEEEFEAGLQKASQDENNQKRGDGIATTADRVSVKIYKVKADTQLGN